MTLHPVLAELSRRLEGAEEGEAIADEQRRAAVAMILWPKTTGPRFEGDVLLMRRAERSDDRWSGQVSLPGGHQDPGDEDLIATAVRESFEEVGVDLSLEARLVGRLPRVQARARGKLLPMGITPVVFQAEGPLSPSPGVEAQEVFWFPLSRARTGELDREYRYRRDDGLIRKLPSWSFDDRVVWGLTHIMLSDLLQRLP